jgi:hypothetical protein
VKRLVDLTIEDLAANPVWRYEGGAGDKAVAAPVKRDSLSQTDDEIFLASTEFELLDTARHSGYCFPADGSSVDYLQPVIVTRSGHVAFWFDEPPTPATLSKQWATLGKEPKDIFPVTFRCLVPVDGQTLSGRIEDVESVEQPPPAVTSIDSPRAPRRRGVGTKETRTARRRPAEMTVEFSQGALYGTGVTGNVSRRGMFVRSSLVPGTGPMLRLTVNLPGGRKLSLRGRVVRTVPTDRPSPTASGFGLRLLEEFPGWEELIRGRGGMTKK